MTGISLFFYEMFSLVPLRFISLATVMISCSPGVPSGALSTVSPTIASSSLHHDALPGADFMGSRFGLKIVGPRDGRLCIYKAFPFSPCYHHLSSLLVDISEYHLPTASEPSISSVNTRCPPNHVLHSLSTRLPTKYPHGS
jgi:hypothetical protein